MKIHLIQRSQGNWDDYHSWIVTASFNEKTAQEYINKFNAKLDRIKQLARETMPKDKDGELDSDHQNYSRYCGIFDESHAQLISLDTLDEPEDHFKELCDILKKEYGKMEKTKTINKAWTSQDTINDFMKRINKLKL